MHRDLIPDLILVSPAERAWSTAEIVAGACELDSKQVQCARELYLATPETTWRLLARRDPALRHILICGHNPGLEPGREPPGSQAAAAQPADRRPRDGRLAPCAMGHAAAGDRRELRAGRPGQPGAICGAALGRALRSDRAAAASGGAGRACRAARPAAGRESCASRCCSRNCARRAALAGVSR